jgi:hypothetical protein
MRVQTKRGFNVGKAVLTAPEMHFVIVGVCVSPWIVAIVSDRHLGFGERRPPLLFGCEQPSLPPVGPRVVGLNSGGRIQ